MTKNYTDYNDRFITDARKLYNEHEPNGGSFRQWMQRTIRKLKWKEGVHFVVYTIPGVRYFNITYKLTNEAGNMMIEELKTYISNQQARKNRGTETVVDMRTPEEEILTQGELPLEAMDEGEVYEGEVVEEKTWRAGTETVISDRMYLQNSFETLFGAVADLGNMIKVVLTRLDTRDQVQQAVPEKKYLTIKEFVQSKGKQVGKDIKFATMQAFGSQVSKYCREYNITTINRKSESYGNIGAYPVQALELVNKEYGFLE